MFGFGTVAEKKIIEENLRLPFTLLLVAVFGPSTMYLDCMNFAYFGCLDISTLCNYNSIKGKNVRGRRQ